MTFNHAHTYTQSWLYLQSTFEIGEQAIMRTFWLFHTCIAFQTWEVDMTGEELKLFLRNQALVLYKTVIWGKVWCGPNHKAILYILCAQC